MIWLFSRASVVEEALIDPERQRDVNPIKKKKKILHLFQPHLADVR